MSLSIVPQSYLNEVIRHAKPRKVRGQLEVSIDLAYMESIYIKQRGRCAYTNAPIKFTDNTASLDRIDNDKGYIEGNVQWVHKDVNMMKRHYSDEYFVKICLMISNNYPRVDQL